MALTFTITDTVAAPPAVVFEHFTAIETWSRWMPNLVGVERLTEGPLAVGSQWREIRKMFRRDAVEQFEVTALEVPTRLSFYIDGRKGTSGSGEYRFDYTFTPEGTGTRLTMHGSITSMGWFATLLGRLLGGVFKKAIAKDHAAFKHYVEQVGGH